MKSPMTVQEDFLTIKFNSFASHGKAVLYAGVDKIKNTFNNWVAAIEYAKKNNMFPIQYTEGGLILDETDNERGQTYSGDDYRRVWKRASIKYCLSIEGSVKTFVCGANDESIFRVREIHAMMRAKYINDINGRDHQEYALLRRATLNRLREENKLLPDDKKLSGKERHHMAINTVFRAIAINEIRDDLTHAQSAQERNDILSRIDHLRNQHEVEMEAKKAAKSSFDAVANDNTNKDGTDEAIEEMLMANPHLQAILAPFVTHAYH